MRVADVWKAVESVAPPQFALSWDNIGLNVGDAEAEVTGVVCALDHSLGALKFALEHDANVLVCHHPMFHAPTRTVTTKLYDGEAARFAIKHDLNVIAAHTNWDAAPGGINDTLADLLGLRQVQAFGTDAGFGQPLGRIGEIDPVSAADFVALVDRTLATRSLVWGDISKSVRRVAVVGGAADGDWPAAHTYGVDLYVTGEVKQHVAMEASAAGMVMLCSGHYATEHPAMPRLAHRLSELLGFDVGTFAPKPGQHGRPH